MASNTRNAALQLVLLPHYLWWMHHVVLSPTLASPMPTASFSIDSFRDISFSSFSWAPNLSISSTSSSTSPSTSSAWEGKRHHHSLHTPQIAWTHSYSFQSTSWLITNTITTPRPDLFADATLCQTSCLLIVQINYAVYILCSIRSEQIKNAL